MAKITAIYDRSSLMQVDETSGHLIGLAILKFHLGITHNALDSLLERLIKTSARWADWFCQNTFLDADGEELPIDELVDEWIIRQCVYIFENKGNNVKQVSLPGAGTSIYGDGDYTLLMESKSNWVPGTTVEDPYE